MEHVAIDLRDDQRRLIDEKIAAGIYADLGAYVADAVRRDAERLAQEKLDALLAEGLASPEVDWNADEIERIKALADTI